MTRGGSAQQVERCLAALMMSMVTPNHYQVLRLKGVTFKTRLSTLFSNTSFMVVYGSYGLTVS